MGPQAAKTDQHYMQLALELAQTAANSNEVPVGAILVCDNQVVAKAYNQKESEACATHHAEILAIEQASQNLKRWRLTDCTLYVTLEPCLMCAGAIVQSRIQRLVYAATDPKAGAIESLYQVAQDPRLNHHVEVTQGVLEQEASKLLKGFFQRRRQENKKN